MQGFITLLILGVIVFAIFLVKEHLRKIREKKNAKEREEKYWSETEPKYRDHKKYPPDWQIRRAFVFFRESGRCEKCKKISGSINKSKLEFWFNPYVRSAFARFVRNSHVHHIKPISAGGNHGLINLQLLCEDCHDREHPEKGLKKSLRKSSIY